MSEQASQIAEKRRKVKGKGERERYTHLKAGFQRKAGRDKKASLSEQCKKKKKKMKRKERKKKTIEWERLEISSRKLELSREHFMQGWA